MQKYLNILFIIYSLTSASCTAMEKNITYAAAFIDDKTIIVGSEKGCHLVNSASGERIRELTPQKTYQIAIQQQNGLIAIKTQKKLLFFDGKTQKKIWSKKSLHPTKPIVFSSIDNTLFRGHEQLRSYNQEDKINPLNEPLNTIFTHSHYISCHPTKNEILYSSDKSILSIAVINKSPYIKRNLTADSTKHISGEYNPDGTMIAMYGDKESYYIYTLGDKLAYRLNTNDKKYVATAFHPHYFILVLLSHDNIIQHWDYQSRTLIAETHPLGSIPFTQRKTPRKLLSFSPNGRQLAAVLKDQYRIIDTPPHNLLLTYLLLTNYELPQELIAIVVQDMTMQCSLSFFNFIALFNVAKLPSGSS